MKKFFFKAILFIFYIIIVLFVLGILAETDLAKTDLLGVFFVFLLALAVWDLIKALYKGQININHIYNDIKAIRMSALKNKEDE